MLMPGDILPQLLSGILQVLNVVIPRPGQGGAPDPPGVGKVTNQGSGLEL